MANDRFDYYTLRVGKWGGVDVLGWGTYAEGSVLAGQPKKVFLGNFDDEASARAAYPKAEQFSNAWTGPRVSLSHLPDENTPAPGGMYPDDI